ncbi:PcfJ domain-containing protein [Polynucleobacter sp. Fuers-14]|uniref:PcfJ domain-containing protein n=1 Tax=Polynucleobacter sp. Fuers-14 TaxID=1758364 RepID=UPI001C0D485B|nr:PcfJ domain-containing protein [Polynucleobacter sp. Fuers-14]MBU3640970.1 PcfJ domain-containing protein [Polynucleobacter sp. Fuers-14]
MSKAATTLLFKPIPQFGDDTEIGLVYRKIFEEILVPNNLIGTDYWEDDQYKYYKNGGCKIRVNKRTGKYKGLEFDVVTLTFKEKVGWQRRNFALNSWGSGNFYDYYSLIYDLVILELEAPGRSGMFGGFPLNRIQSLKEDGRRSPAHALSECASYKFRTKKANISHYYALNRFLYPIEEVTLANRIFGYSNVTLANLSAISHHRAIAAAYKELPQLAPLLRYVVDSKYTDNASAMLKEKLIGHGLSPGGWRYLVNQTARYNECFTFRGHTIYPAIPLINLMAKATIRLPFGLLHPVIRMLNDAPILNEALIDEYDNGINCCLAPRHEKHMIRLLKALIEDPRKQKQKINEFQIILDWVLNLPEDRLLSKDMTLQTMRTRTDQWHEQLNQAKREEMAADKWDNALIKSVAIDGYQFTALESELDLYDEGKALHHCVSTYAPSAKSGSSLIFSIDGKERATLELHLDKRVGAISVRQIRGHCNALVDANTERACVKLMRLYEQKILGFA